MVRTINKHNIIINCIFDALILTMYLTGHLSVSLVSSSTTTLTISLTLTLSTEPGLMADSYTISHSSTNTECFDTSDGIDAVHGSSETQYTLTGLQEGTEYSITVTALLSDGETAEDSLMATTTAAG